jgi:cell shape-determining protein MreC
VPVAVSHAGSGLAGLLQVFRLPAILRENEQLQQEKAYLQGRLDALQAAGQDNENLRKQLGLGTADGCRAVHAAVIARPFDLWLDNVVLNVGAEHGVQAGCLVANADGLVGKVTESGQGFCRVELATSPKFRLAGVAKPGSVEGIVRGVAPGELALDYVQALAHLDMGDKIFTRGGARIPTLDGVAVDPRTPRDIYIGQVVEKTSEQGFLRIKLKPAVDINRLDALTVYTE